LREDRIPVVAGGVAIMSGIFAELDLHQMTVAEGALRQGVLWDLLGRVHHRDIRDVTVEQFAKRHHVDGVQAQRVASLTQSLMDQLVREDPQLEPVRHFLDWAGRLHEVGISIAQGAYHKHSAYILANADMPGFSRQEQAWLSNLVLAQRGKLAKMRAAFEADARLATLAFCLRVAVIVYRSRRTLKLPPLRASRRGKTFRLELEPAWLADQTLIALALDAERPQWASVGFALELS
jgi:exopolyphosphatase / guanosine-5'-triphosphate,3'-diphosphate pyrophosphatase